MRAHSAGDHAGSSEPRKSRLQRNITRISVTLNDEVTVTVTEFHS